MERNFVELEVKTFSELITNKEINEKIELILSEYEYEKYTTLRVPTTLTINHMKDLLLAKDSIERKQMFNFLFVKEFSKLKDIIRRKEHSQEFWAQKNERYSQLNSDRTGLWDKDNNLVYGLWHNSLFSKISKNAVNRLSINKLRVTALFGQKLVIDLDYDRYMTLTECRLLAQQLGLLYNNNRYRSREPFDLHFTNCDPNMPTMEAIPRYLQHFNSPYFMSTIHKESYLDLFPKERLVYLTPHAKESLTTYDLDDIYIIGGFVDKSCHEPISLIKAKKEGIRSVRLPLDEHIIWGVGCKNLCLNHIVAILHDVKITGDWKKSLIDNIPQRKQKKIEEIEYEDMLRKQQLIRRKKIENWKRKEAID
jgi:ribonuclease P protein 1